MKRFIMVICMLFVITLMFTSCECGCSPCSRYKAGNCYVSTDNNPFNEYTAKICILEKKDGFVKYDRYYQDGRTDKNITSKCSALTNEFREKLEEPEQKDVVPAKETGIRMKIRKVE